MRLRSVVSRDVGLGVVQQARVEGMAGEEDGLLGEDDGEGDKEVVDAVGGGMMVDGAFMIALGSDGSGTVDITEWFV